MEYLSMLNYGELPSREGLLRFLEDARTQSRESGREVMVNITSDVFHIDPLAVLATIYERDQRHFYLESPREELAIAGAEAQDVFTCRGTDRFEQVKGWADDWLTRTRYTNTGQCELSGMHFYACFNFFDEVGEVDGFPAAQAFVPTWQVVRREGQCMAVANCIIDADADVETMAGRIFGAHAKFQSFEFSTQVAEGSEPAQAAFVPGKAIEDPKAFEASVASGVELIAQKAFEKIVLARTRDYEVKGDIPLVDWLNELRNRYPTCHCFSFKNEAGLFMGATPEILIRVEGGRFYVDALAGSVGRGDTAVEDARLEQCLLRSDKDRREHAAVVESISRRLSLLGIEVKPATYPKLLKLANVQHLHTPISGLVPEGLHILDLVKALHPTPAVGGKPREQACDAIPGLENFNRGPYAGPVGWFDVYGEGLFVVGIRSALLCGDRMRLFAGAGIVRGSDPEKEKVETDLKFQALGAVIGLTDEHDRT